MNRRYLNAREDAYQVVRSVKAGEGHQAVGYKLKAGEKAANSISQQRRAVQDSPLCDIISVIHRERKAFSGVGTAPAYRLRGLANEHYSNYPLLLLSSFLHF